jgi:hypothetical protein
VPQIRTYRPEPDTVSDCVPPVPAVVERTDVHFVPSVEVGLSVVRRMDIRRQARPYLEELAERTGEMVHRVQPQATMSSSRTARRAVGSCAPAATPAVMPANCMLNNRLERAWSGFFSWGELWGSHASPENSRHCS